MNWTKIFLIAIAYVIIAQVVHTAGTLATMNYYFDETFFPVWSKIMMPGEGAPPAEFYYHSIAFNFIGGLIFIVVYAYLRPAIKGASAVKRGVNYGLLVFLIAGVPGALAVYLLINLPAVLIVTWAVENLVIYLLGGIVVAKML